MTNEQLNKIINDIDMSLPSFIDNGHGVMLTQREIDVLKKYEIKYEQYLNIKSLLFSIEDVLSSAIDLLDEEYDELDSVANTIAERDYYFYTNH